MNSDIINSKIKLNYFEISAVIINIIEKNFKEIWINWSI